MFSGKTVIRANILENSKIISNAGRTFKLNVPNNLSKKILNILSLLKVNLF